MGWDAVWKELVKRLSRFPDVFSTRKVRLTRRTVRVARLAMFCARGTPVALSPSRCLDLRLVRAE